MKVTRFQKWLIGCLLGVSCFGLILLKLPDKSRHPIPPIENSPAKRANRTNHAFAIDKEMSTIPPSKATPRYAPLIGKSLLSFLSEGKPRHQSERRTLITDVEDYEVEVKKLYTIFYYAPSLFPDSRQKQIDALRRELYDENLPTVRRQAIRKVLKDLLKDAQLVPFMHNVILYPLDSSRHDQNHDLDHH